MAASNSKEQDVLTLDDAHLSGIRAWLSSTSTIEELRHTIQTSPVAFLAAHIQSLPAHLLEPFGSSTSAQQRSSVPLVLERRRRWAARHNERPSRASADDVEGGEESHAHILDLESSKQRLPEIWASTVGQSSITSTRTPRRRPTRPRGQQQQLDPPFPDHPAATVNGYETAAAASGSARKYGPAHEGDLYSHPRLARLMDEQDEEERREEEREREARRAEQPEEEEEEEEDEVDDEEMEEELIEVFRRAVVERLVKGDPTIPASLYASVDFQDLPEEGFQQSSSTSSRVEQSDSMMRPSRQQELLDEERYFDDDDDDDEEASAQAEGDATNAEIDY